MMNKKLDYSLTRWSGSYQRGGGCNPVFLFITSSVILDIKFVTFYTENGGNTFKIAKMDYILITKLHFSTLAQAYVECDVEYLWNHYDKPILMAGSKPGLANN